jgi:replicative DNA helicase
LRRGAQIEDAERRLYELAESGRYDGGFQRLRRRSPSPSIWRPSLPARRQAVGHRTRLARSRHQDGRAAASDLIIVAGRPGMGKTALATNIAYNVAKRTAPKSRPTAP